LLEDHQRIAAQDSKRGEDAPAEKENRRDEIGETRNDKIPMQELPDKWPSPNMKETMEMAVPSQENKLQRHGAVVKQRFARQSQRGQERVLGMPSPAFVLP